MGKGPDNPILKTIEKVEQMPNEQWKAWAKNLLKFTAPALAVFFGQLALGVDPRAALAVALLALYGAASDLFKKINE